MNRKYLQNPVNKCSALDYISKQNELHPILAVTEITSPSSLLAFFSSPNFKHLFLQSFSPAQSDFHWSIKMTPAHQSIFLALMLSSATKHRICFCPKNGNGRLYSSSRKTTF